jgi:pimeloyl-ACP methyl ester carboxylesterase
MPAPLPLILLPGLLCDQALWQNQINHLKDIADCTVADTTRFDNVGSVASDVLCQAPPRFALAGLSMGGYVALEIMRQSPGRVVKLALFDTSARPDTPEQQERRRLLLAMSKSGQFKGVTPRLLPLLIHPDRIGDKELTGIIMEMAERVGHNTFQNQQTAIMNRPDSRPSLVAIHCPTLLIGGRQDAITPPEMIHEMAVGIRNAQAEIIEHCGHLSVLERPDEVNRLMRQWLST